MAEKARLAKYLVPRTFYFIVEPGGCSTADCASQGIPCAAPDAKVHIDVAIQRGKAPRSPAPKSRLLLRTWSKEEARAFCYVKGEEQAGTSKKISFHGEMKQFPTAGVAIADLPCLVLVTEWLEPDREFYAVARVHNGEGWSRQERIGQTRLDFIDENGGVIRDPPLANPKPKIDASVATDLIDRKSVSGDGVKITLTKIDIEDCVPLKAVYVNGKAIYTGQDSESNWLVRVTEGKDQEEQKKIDRGAYLYRLKSKRDLPAITDGSPRIEIVAENAVGNRSQAVKIYRPNYATGTEKPIGGKAYQQGQVMSYEADDGKGFAQEGAWEKPDRVRIRYYAVPYLDLFVQSGAHGDKRRHVNAALTGAWAVSGTIRLHEWGGEETIPGVGQQPYVGMYEWAPPVDKVNNALAAEVPLKMTSNAWVWVSDPLVVVPWGQGAALMALPPDGEDANIIMADLGGLVQAYVGRAPREEPSSAQVYGTFTTGADFGSVASPKAVAAGVRLVSRISRDPLPAVKNGDLLRVELHTASALPSPLVQEAGSKTASDPSSGGAEKRRLSVVQAEGSTNDGAELQVYLSNRNDLGAEDEQRRDSDAKTKNFLTMVPVEIKVGDGAATFERAEQCLLSREVVRLVTQEFMPLAVKAKLAKAVKDDTERMPELEGKLKGLCKWLVDHQILPGGYLFVASTPLEGGLEVPGAFRTLEITKRWYIDDRPSVQPAFAGTNPRVGGPGTHRVRGLNHKLRDGSVYVHNGEFFQAAEDLHIPGKIMDLTFRRTYLSHSLFTTDLGRNWDWIGNMRLVETVNGDVYLMNGEAQVEHYDPDKDGKAAGGPKPLVDPVEELEHLAYVREKDNGQYVVKDSFDYSYLFEISQYRSPAGAYRSLIKARPVEIPGMAKPDQRAEDARYYLVGKHGTVWTFVEDPRYRNNQPVQPETTGLEHEPAPGVCAQYLLVCVHDRRQTNYHKFQRNASGLVEAVIDDYGRVTRIGHVSASGPDAFITSIKDFAGREIEIARQDDVRKRSRNLTELKGPSISGRKPTLTYKYTDPPRSSDTGTGALGPQHRLEQVVDPAENASGTKRPYLRIDKWNRSGRVEEMTVCSQFPRIDRELQPVASKLKSVGRSHDAPIAHRYVLSHSVAISQGQPGDATSSVRYAEGTDSQFRQSSQSQHEYTIVARPGRDFLEVASHSVFLAKQHVHDDRFGSRPGQPAGILPAARDFLSVALHSVLLAATGLGRPAGSVPAVTYFCYNDDGELNAVRHPAGNCEYLVYHSGSSQSGNLEEQGLRTQKGDSVERTSHCYDLRHNFPNKTLKDAYIDELRPHTSETAMEYDQQGNLTRVTEPDLTRYAAERQLTGDESTRNYRTWLYRDSDGQEQQHVDARGVETRSYYYEPSQDHKPGDANDLAGMLAMARRKPGKTSPRRISIDRWGQLKFWGRTSMNRGDLSRPLSERQRKAHPSGYERQEIRAYAQSLITTVRPDLLGNPVVTVDPDGGVREQQFNAVSQPTRDAELNYYEYDINNLVTSIAEQASHMAPPHKRGVRHFVNDGLGNVLAEYILAVQNGDGSSQNLIKVATHDVHGNEIASIDEGGYRATYEYDARGMLVKRVLDSAGLKITDRYWYDPNRSLRLHKDPCNWFEGWKYDSAGRLAETVGKTGLVTRIDYGPGGAEWRRWEYEPSSVRAAGERDRLRIMEGDLSACIQVRTAATTVAKQKYGPVAPKGTVLSGSEFWRDERGQLHRERRIRREASQGDLDVKKLFDPDATVDLVTTWTNDGLSAMTWVEDSTSNSQKVEEKVATRYDKLGRLSLWRSHATWESYEYGMGNVVRVTTPDGMQTRCVDENNRMSRVYDDGRELLLEAKQYSDSGLLLSQYLCGGQTNEVHKYDDANRCYKTTTLSWSAGVDISSKSKPSAAHWLPTPPLQIVRKRAFAPEGHVKEEVLTDAAGRVRLVQSFSDSCFFGPKTSKLGERIREKVDRFDNNGNKLSWTDGNRTRFDACHDGEGRTWGTTATGAGAVAIFGIRLSGPRSRMHLRAIQRDALGRPIMALEHCQLHYAGRDKLAGTEYHPVISRFGYDTLGGTVWESQRIGGCSLVPGPQLQYATLSTRTIRYVRTATGMVKEVQYPRGPWQRREGNKWDVEERSGPKAQYVLDPANRPVKVTWAEPDDSETHTLVEEAEYDPSDGRLGRLKMAHLKPTHGASKPFAAQLSASVPLGWKHGTKIESSARLVAASKPTQWQVKKFDRYHIKDWGEWQDRTSLQYVDRVTTQGTNGRTAQEHVKAFLIHERQHFDLGKNPLSKSYCQLDDTEVFMAKKGDSDERERWKRQGRSRSLSTGYHNGVGTVQYVKRLNQDDDGHEWLSNSYLLDRTNQTRDGIILRGIGGTGGGPPRTSEEAARDQRSTFNIQTYRDGSTLTEPGVVICRDAFGRPAAVVRNEQGMPTEKCTYHYDAFDRPVLKYVPALPRIGRRSISDGIVIDVNNATQGTHRNAFDGTVLKYFPALLTIGQTSVSDGIVIGVNKATQGLVPRVAHVFRQTAAEAIAYIGSFANKNQGRRYIIRLHGKPKARAIVDALAALKKLVDAKPKASLYSHIAFEWADRLQPEDVQIYGFNITGLGNLSFTGFSFGSVRLKDCPAVTFDACTFNGGTYSMKIVGGCSGLQVQNCVFSPRTRCVWFEDAVFTSALFAFNRFEIMDAYLGNSYRGPEPFVVLYPKWSKATSGDLGWFRLGIYNNVFIGQTSFEYCHHVSSSRRVRTILYASNNTLVAPAVHAALAVAWWSELRELLAEARTGKPFANQGTADLPGEFSLHPPVLWDREGRLRDPKYPTLGPVEVLPDGQAERVAHRYIYDGQQLAVRETYPYGAGQAVDLRGPQGFATRLVQAIPGGGGPVVYVDEDRTTDVQMMDRTGRPWFLYRAREGLRRHWAKVFADDTYTARTMTLRHSGLAEPLNLPRGPFLEYAPWCVQAMEPDVLLGRRGVMGWDGEAYDRGLILYPPEQAATPAKMAWGDFVLGSIITGINNIVVIGGTVVLCVVIPPAIPFVVSGFVVYGGAMTAQGVHQRLQVDQTWGQAIGGTLADTLILGGIYTGVTGKDIATGRDLELSSFERGQAFGRGVVQAAALAYGGYRLVRLGRTAWAHRSEVRFLREVAYRAQRHDPRPGSIPGILKHTWAERFVRHYQYMHKKIGRGLTVEQIYVERGPVPGKALPAGSVKLDVVAGKVARPAHLYDYKFTKNPTPVLSPRRIAQIRNVVGLDESIPIEVIHPSQWSSGASGWFW